MLASLQTNARMVCHSPLTHQPGTQDKETRMVATDGLALEARRLHAALAERAGAVLSLEQRRARLAASLQLRLRAIQARNWGSAS